MKKEKTICLIGDILIDVTLKNNSSDTKLRLGGIVHAARALWALEIPFDVYYFSPAYLDDQIKEYLLHLGCIKIVKLGNIIGAPYVFLIQEAKEIGDQGYEFLLRNELTINYQRLNIDLLHKAAYEDHLIISGNFDLNAVINGLNNNIYVDIANNINDFEIFKAFDRKLQTIFISTSSDIFKNHFTNDFLQFVKHFEKYTDEVIIKENRGGSRGYHFAGEKFFQACSQPRKIAHSIGVGDVFDATYISSYHIKDSYEQKLTLSSWIAAEYAVTSFPDDFKKGCNRVLKSNIRDLVNIPGISLPWETRKTVNIYIAAPDFTFLDVTPINILENALLYHNFSPRRPIRENGQMEENATKARRQELFTKDMILLNECSMLIAVLLFNDPGTLIELGYASSKGIPTIVYDPFRIATNCMLTELPDLISDDLDEIINEVFSKISYMKNYEK